MQVTLQSKFVFSIAIMLHSCLFIFFAHLPCDLAGQVSGLFPYGGRESGTRGRGTVVIVFHNTVGVVSYCTYSIEVREVLRSRDSAR